MTGPYRPDACDQLIHEALAARTTRPNRVIDHARKTLRGDLVPLGEHILAAFKLDGHRLIDASIAPDGSIAICSQKGDMNELMVVRGFHHRGPGFRSRFIADWGKTQGRLTNLWCMDSDNVCYTVEHEGTTRLYTQSGLVFQTTQRVRRVEIAPTSGSREFGTVTFLITTDDGRTRECVQWLASGQVQSDALGRLTVRCEGIGFMPNPRSHKPCPVYIEYDRNPFENSWLHARLIIDGLWTSGAYQLIARGSFALRDVPPSLKHQWTDAREAETPQPSFVAWDPNMEWVLVFQHGTVPRIDDGQTDCICLKDGRIIFGHKNRESNKWLSEPLAHWESTSLGIKRGLTRVIQMQSVGGDGRLAVLMDVSEEDKDLRRLHFFDHQGPHSSDDYITLPGATTLLTTQDGFILTDPMIDGHKGLHWEHFDHVHTQHGEGHLPAYGPVDRLTETKHGLMTWACVEGTFYVIRYNLPALTTR